MTDRMTDHDLLTGRVAESEAFRRAHERAEMVQGLYIHILVYAAINLGLFGINVLTRGGEGGWWFQWPLLVWGLGLFIHVLVTVAPVFSPEWADRRAERTLRAGGPPRA